MSIDNDHTKPQSEEPSIGISQESQTGKYQASHRLIAKNAIFLYVRMILTMTVGFITSRVVLNTLGVTDYGVYGVVGSVLAMTGFLNASMSTATSRFLTFELGRGDKKRLADTFSSALIIHMFIALFVLIFAETVGLWFLNNKLVIPEGRMYAAHWVFQLSIASAMLGITQAPYGATLVAHERMTAYAYFDIVSAVLRLLIVYLLTLTGFDKLIFYSILSVTVSVIIRVSYRIFCIMNFEETRFHWVWNKKILKPMLNFSGWDLYGNGCVSLRAQGATFLINIFFGVAYNAANSIALSVQGLFNHFVINVTQAFRPAIIKSYASGNIRAMQRLMDNTIRLCSTMFGCIFFPLQLFLPRLLEIWLKNVPDHALGFARLTLLHSMFFLITMITNIGIHATGNVKRISFITGTLLMLNFPLLWLAFRMGLSANWTYYLLIGTSVIGIFLNSFILSIQVPGFSFPKYMLTILTCELFICFSSIPSLFFWKYVDTTSFINFLILVAITTAFSFIWPCWTRAPKRWQEKSLTRNSGIVNPKSR